MKNFTPVSAAIGGLLIGLSAALLWIAKGRIAGISGIVGGFGALRPGDIALRADAERRWSVLPSTVPRRLPLTAAS